MYSLLSHADFFFYFKDELQTELPTEYPYPCRMSAQQARIGSSQVLHLPAILQHRRRLAGWLENRIGWYGMESREIGECAWLRYSFLVENRADFIERFRKSFDLGVWFTSVVEGRSTNYRAVGYEIGTCPTAERVAQHIVNLPTHPRIPFDFLCSEVERNLGWIRASLIRL